MFLFLLLYIYFKYIIKINSVKFIFMFVCVASYLSLFELSINLYSSDSSWSYFCSFSNSSFYSNKLDLIIIFIINV